jgi:hypothetical protein
MPKKRILTIHRLIVIQRQRIDYCDDLQFTMQKIIVLGYGKYETISNFYLNKIIHFETLIQYFFMGKN